MKRFLSLILSLVIVIGIITSVPVTVSAADSRVEYAINWAIGIANDNNYGYSQVNRYGNPDYDCSSLVSTAFHNAGFNVACTLNTRTMKDAFINAGFTWIPASSISGFPSSCANLQRGDILLASGHTELYIGNGQNVGAHMDYNGIPGGIGGGKTWSDGYNAYRYGADEIDVCKYWNDNWLGVLRYDGSDYSEPPIDIGDAFFAVILNTAYWKPITGNADASVTLEKEKGVANQLWYFDRQDDGSYVITSASNGNALEMDCGYTTSGNPVVYKEYWGGNYQKWWIYRQGDGYVFVSKHYPEYNLAITLNNNSSANGTKITTSTRCNDSSQIWSVYLGDEVQLKPATLNVSAGNSATNTTFTWNDVYGEKYYDLKIWKNELYSGEVYHIEWGATSGYKIHLPAGTYQAYVDALNHYECKMSNVVTFTVSEKTYNVTYNANGGSGAPASQTKTYGKTLTLSSIKPTRSGYTFIGWSTNKNATSATYSAGSSFTTNADTTLYAIWKVNSYTVYFNTNGGSCSTSSKSVTYNSTYGTLPTPTRSGYTFDGWYTAKTGGTKITASTKYTTAGNITLYAHWTQNHSHSYTSQITKAPTCTETGIRKYTCSCGASYTQTIAATGHTSSDWIIYWYPSADSDGYGYRECEVCYEVLDEQYYDQYECDTPYLYEIVNTAKGVKIEWEDVYGADNYIVYRRTYNATAKKWGGWVRFANNVTSTSYTDTTAKSGVYYIYTVRAKNEAGLSGYDSTGLKIKFLSTPKLTGIANATGKVTVKWNKVSGATGYIVYRKTYNASTKTWSGWSRLATTKSNSYNDTKAKSGTYYRYTVRAYSGDYTSYFDTTGLKTKYLATPTLKSVASAKSGVTVKWGKVTGATGYIVYRKTGSGSWKQMAVVKGNTKVSYLDKTAKKGTTYKYTVRAYYGSYRSYFNTKGLTIKDKY